MTQIAPAAATPTTATTPTTAATPTSTATGASSLAAVATAPGGPLGENEFLQLMMTQMKDQDPLSPSDPSQYLSELAQFTSVEQATQTAQSTAAIATEQHAATAISLLGRTVTYLDAATGQKTTGTVQKVDFTANGATLTIDGVSGIEPSMVSQVS